MFPCCFCALITWIHANGRVVRATRLLTEWSSTSRISRGKGVLFSGFVSYTSVFPSPSYYWSHGRYTRYFFFRISSDFSLTLPLKLKKKSRGDFKRRSKKYYLTTYVNQTVIKKIRFYWQMTELPRKRNEKMNYEQY